MITQLVLLIGLPAGFSFAQFDPICFITGPAATFYKINATHKEVITDGSTLDASKTTFFIIHGWNETSTSGEYEDIGRALSESGNAILVDYTHLGRKFYGTCAYYIVDTLGVYVANFIKEETEAGSMHPSRIHIIGHSAGGQAAGKIGREVKAKTGTKIKRISALDPAGPFYTLIIIRIPELSIGPDDAEMVDALHTSVLFGELARMGTVDFFARSWLGLPDLQHVCGLLSPIFCSHQFSRKLFLEAITSCGIVGSKDLNPSKKMVYGMHMDLSSTGLYSFYTNSKPLYGKGNPTCF